MTHRASLDYVDYIVIYFIFLYYVKISFEYITCEQKLGGKVVDKPIKEDTTVSNKATDMAEQMTGEGEVTQEMTSHRTKTTTVVTRPVYHGVDDSQVTKDSPMVSRFICSFFICIEKYTCTLFMHYLQNRFSGDF